MPIYTCKTSRNSNRTASLRSTLTPAHRPPLFSLLERLLQTYPQSTAARIGKQRTKAATTSPPNFHFGFTVPLLSRL